VRSTLNASRPIGLDGAQVVLMASALPGEGKTVSAVSLARTMAMSGDRVLIIDCDLRRNSLRFLLPTTPTAGLVEVLAGKATLEEATQRDKLENLWILPLTATAFTPRDVFGDDRMRQVLAEARKHYDYIVLDGPPLLVVTDARVLSTLADQVVMAIRWAKTPVFAVETAIANLRTDDAAFRGVILTQVDSSSRSKLSEYDSAYYSKEYGRYYQE
jgi:capsular exopolysaccharide synthesis family protein